LELEALVQHLVQTPCLAQSLQLVVVVVELSKPIMLLQAVLVVVRVVALLVER
jgi:hypothetical protein